MNNKPNGQPGSLQAIEWYCHLRRQKGDKNAGTWHDSAAVMAYQENQPPGPFAFNFERWVALFKRFYNRCFGCYMYDSFFRRDVFWQPAEVMADCGELYYGVSAAELRRLWRSGAMPGQAAREHYDTCRQAELNDYIDWSCEARAWNNLAATGDPEMSVAEAYAADRMW